MYIHNKITLWPTESREQNNSGIEREGFGLRLKDFSSYTVKLWLEGTVSCSGQCCHLKYFEALNNSINSHMHGWHMHRDLALTRCPIINIWHVIFHSERNDSGFVDPQQEAKTNVTTLYNKWQISLLPLVFVVKSLINFELLIINLDVPKNVKMHYFSVVQYSACHILSLKTARRL